ncbi:Alanine racemase [Vibrio stylophorae]|uniref:Alanine racemase n=1 Tax=Vibrio stylophorae TaxID=659351 RepID=A0ABN8DMR6_9VIBR|nr:alanine racemase [Vibrio stylophorae]CAH0532419.1 Alanine racemase [Vibrio stylophorae]
MIAATAQIDLNALQANWQKLRQQASNSKLLAVVKANGYGGGLVPTAKALTDADAFGVARFEEALILRAGGIDVPILLLEGFYHPDALPQIADLKIETVVHSFEQLEALEQAQLSRPIPVWLKIDTGMHRLGIRAEQVDEVVARLHACDNVAKPVRYISHFACADELSNPLTEQQIACFEKLTEGHRGERSIAASAGILSWPQSHYDWVRPGIILYGVSPFAEKCGQDLGYQPVMRLSSSIIAVRDHKKGEPVGYGSTWRADRDTKLGVIAIGYGDGYPRLAPSGTPVWVCGKNGQAGRMVSLAGRVSMDMITVDLGPDATEQVGDEVVLWGPELPVERIAEGVGTIGYELVTQLTQRVRMVYID